LENGNSEVKVEVSELKSGIYFLEVLGEERKYQDKILITR
jgi:hypothetical protein